MYYRIVRVVWCKKTEKGNYHIALEVKDDNGKTFITAVNRRHLSEANLIKAGDFIKL